MNSPKLRGYRPDDAVHLAAIYVRAITVLGPRGYSPDQVAAWAGDAATPEETHVRCSDGRSVWVSVDDSDTAIAFIDLEADGHIDMMFCMPEWARRGVASALYERLEAHAVVHAMSRLYVEASEVAKPFFLRRDFRLLRRNDMKIEGVAIHNHVMEKILRALPSST